MEAREEEDALCQLVYKELDRQQETPGSSRLVCCAISKLDQDLPIPIVPPELHGKTEFPDICVSPGPNSSLTSNKTQMVSLYWLSTALHTVCNIGESRCSVIISVLTIYGTCTIDPYHINIYR